MSFGALSANAVEAMNRGAALAPCLHNTGEGGLAPAHLHGGELVFQVGTGYFGCRDERGRFSLDALKERLSEAPVRAIEIKLSQGAKPGLGGMLPATKVTEEIARIRGVRPGEDCVSPARHSAFGTVDELVDFCELLGQETGLPVGFKSAVGQDDFWDELAARMAATGTGPDFVTVDGGEGGTGAAPLAFSDHVALPFKIGFARVFGAFARQGLHEDVVFVGSGRLGFPQQALFAMAIGCDMVSLGRESMLAVGCIQAQRCHTGRCPTGVATQSRWLMHGLDPSLKSARLANYIRALRGETLAMARSCGVVHPALVTPDQLEIIAPRFVSRTVEEVFGLDPAWRRSDARRREIEALIGRGHPHRPPGPQSARCPGTTPAGPPASRSSPTCRARRRGRGRRLTRAGGRRTVGLPCAPAPSSWACCRWWPSPRRPSPRATRPSRSRCPRPGHRQRRLAAAGHGRPSRRHRVAGDRDHHGGRGRAADPDRRGGGLLLADRGRRPSRPRTRGCASSSTTPPTRRSSTRSRRARRSGCACSSSRRSWAARATARRPRPRAAASQPLALRRKDGRWSLASVPRRPRVRYRCTPAGTGIRISATATGRLAAVVGPRLDVRLLRTGTPRAGKMRLRFVLR